MRKTVLTSELFECKVEYLNTLFSTHFYPWEMLPDISSHIKALKDSGKLSDFSEISENVFIGKNVKIYPSAVIEAPAIIGDDTEIRPGAFIRGNVITGRKCVIGNSTELKNSILLDNVQVPHYNYVGDSILGNFAHMGAGSICSNLKSDKTSVVVHGDEEFQTGLRKVGAILGDRADVGCGCVLNPGTVIGKNTSVYPLTPLRGVYPSDCIVKNADTIVLRK